MHSQVASQETGVVSVHHTDVWIVYIYYIYNFYNMLPRSPWGGANILWLSKQAVPPHIHTDAKTNAHERCGQCAQSLQAELTMSTNSIGS
jgi:hypothetical protein